MSPPVSTLDQGARRRRRPGRWLEATLLVLVLGVSWPLASAQGTPTPEQEAPPPLAAPTDAPQGEADEAPPAESNDATTAATTPLTTTHVSADSTGGPLTLPEDVEAAVATWREAVPDLVNLSVVPTSSNLAPRDGDRVVFADPGLLGPDTLSLGLRLQGTKGIEVRLAAETYRAHPAVLLHEVGVFLGLPEGADDGVMAFKIPTEGELTAPSPADVAALRERLRFRPEDLTRDGVVDFDDLVAFGQAYGSMGLNLPADLDGDGAVGPSDLERLRAAYTFTLPADEGDAPDAGQGSDEAPPDDGDAPVDGDAPSDAHDTANDAPPDDAAVPGATPDLAPEAPPGTVPPDQDAPTPSPPADGG